MATRGNQTCVELQDVAKGGFLNKSNSLFVKGTWFPKRFSLAVTDGIDAWRIDASEDFVAELASAMRVAVGQCVDKAHLHLGTQQANSLYSLHAVSYDTVQLTCTPKNGRDLTAFTVSLTLKLVPAMDITYDMLQFLMHSFEGLKEESERKSREFERVKAITEKSLTDLQAEKLQLELDLRKQISGLNTTEDMIALITVPSTPTGKRRSGAGAENASVKKKPKQKGRPKSKGSKAHRLADGIPESSKLGTPTAALGVGTEEATIPISYSGFHTDEKATVDGQSLAGDQSDYDDGGEFRDRSDKNVMAKLNIDGSLEIHRNPTLKLGIPEELVKPATRKQGQQSRKRGRQSKASVKQAEVTGKKSSLVPTSTGELTNGDSEYQVSERRIEDQAARAIKLLEPFTSPAISLGARPTISGNVFENLTEVERGSPQLRKSDQKRRKQKNSFSEDDSPESRVSVPLSPLADNGVVILPEPLKEFDVINADFHDFDSDRTQQAMALDQYWALYDDQDGMPRFYGRICKLNLQPFEVQVEWLEPHNPSLRASGLVKSAVLSAGCGEFLLGLVTDQPLAAFSHRIEVEIDSRKGVCIFRLYPRKGEVWALYKDWDKAKSKQLKKDDEVKYDYELVEVLTDYGEKGLKVRLIEKVPGFKTMFKPGNTDLENWISPKTIQSRFSHQIATYHFDEDQMQGVPEGSFELDSASTPDEYMSLALELRKIDAPVLASKVLQTVSESG